MVDPTDGVLGEQINAQLTKCSKIMDAQGKFCLEVRTTCSILHHYKIAIVMSLLWNKSLRFVGLPQNIPTKSWSGTAAVLLQPSFLTSLFLLRNSHFLSPKDSRKLIIDDRTISHVDTQVGPRFCKASLKPSNKILKLYGSRYAADQFFYMSLFAAKFALYFAKMKHIDHTISNLIIFGRSANQGLILPITPYVSCTMCMIFVQLPCGSKCDSTIAYLILKKYGRVKLSRWNPRQI